MSLELTERLPVVSAIKIFKLTVRIGQHLAEAVGYAAQGDRDLLNIGDPGQLYCHGVAAITRTACHAPYAASDHRTATRHRVIEGKNKAVVTTAVAAFHAR